MTRWLSDHSWPIGITLVGIGISWGLMTAAVHDSVKRPEMDLHVLRDSIEKADLRRIMIDNLRVSIQIKCNPLMKPSPFDDECKPLR